MSAALKNLIAAAIGVVCVAVPLVALCLFFDGSAPRRASHDIATAAAGPVDLADIRLDAVLTALNALAASGVDGCSPDQIAALRQAGLSDPWVKQFAVIGDTGQALCSDVRLDGPVTVLETRKAAHGGADIELVRIGDHSERMLRLSRPSGTDRSRSLAALMAPDIAVAQPARPQQDRELSLVTLLEIVIAVSGFATLSLIAIAFILRQRDNPVAELERGLRRGEFVPFYQPVVDITNGRLRGAEVLMRWKKSDGTIVPPAHFIPLAESSGLILAMTRSMMRHVVADMGKAFALRPKLKLGFNMSAAHFSNDAIVTDLRAVFEGAPIRYSQICLEVTERQPVESLTQMRRVIAALQGMGVRIAIDDVGAGHAGLSYILKLGVDIIKIDKMFVDALGRDSHSSTIIEMLVDLSNTMRMDVIAEGVETFEQVIVLRDRGIRTAQGHVFAPALPASAFLDLVEAVDPRTGADAVPAFQLGPLRSQVTRGAASAA